MKPDIRTGWPYARRIRSAPLEKDAGIPLPRTTARDPYAALPPGNPAGWAPPASGT